MVYGYIRVSTREQNEDRQRIALRRAGVPDKNIYMDKQSGKDFDRPRYKVMVRRLRRDDLLYIKSIDRLGRDYEEVLEQWRYLTKEKNVDIVVLDMPLLDTRRGRDLMGAFLADIVLQVLSFVAENERANIRQRQAEGIAAAKARGVHFGRDALPLPDNFYEVYGEWKAKRMTIQQAAEACGLPRSTFYDKVQKHEMMLRIQREDSGKSTKRPCTSCACSASANLPNSRPKRSKNRKKRKNKKNNAPNNKPAAEKLRRVCCVLFAHAHLFGQNGAKRGLLLNFRFAAALIVMS